MSRFAFIGFICGLTLIVGGGVKADPALPIQDVARMTWPTLSADEQYMVDLVAKDFFEKTLSAEARRRIGGSDLTRFEDLPAWHKAPFRGQALRDLGHQVKYTPPDAI